MTNHWADMANSTCIIVWGANPAENHPASIAHIGRARFPQQFFGATDPVRAAKQPARLIVIDPRKTRTASLVDPAKGDAFIRIRPGTDIALAMGLTRYMIEKIEGYNGGTVAEQAVYDNFMAYLNQGGTADPTAYNGTWYADDNSNTTKSVPRGDAGGQSKYTDARFLVKADGTDYQRDRIEHATGNVTAIAADATTISDFPLKAGTVTGDPNTVYNRLKTHVSPYTLAAVADICGCSTSEIELIGDAFIENSRCSSGAIKDARDPAYRATTLLYAMGLTQHTCGAQNVKSFAVLQSLMGNMGRAGGGINALRGIHNVQGSTDMGLLYGNIPAYSGNPTVQVDAIPSTNNAFGKYMDGLWGNPVSGTGARASMDLSYDDAYNTTPMGLQQRGFYNMTLKWFGDYASINGLALGAAKRAAVDACYSLWPKGNGDNHIEMFRKMGTGETKACVAWGQNPAVTEPNQGAVRAGLYNVDILVCVDMFLNETAAVSRKPGGVTILIPTAAHVEKAGSSTNSGRTLQWRYQATPPAGNSKDDTELLLRLAKAFDTAGAFQHIKDVWDTNGITYDTSVYKQLYGNPYGYIAGTDTYSAVSGSAETVVLRTNVTDPVSYTTGTVTGSEWVSELVYREMCTGVGGGGTIWIYTNAYVADFTSNRHAASVLTMAPGSAAPTAQPNWGAYNRSKCRDNGDGNFQMAYPGWGYAWLVNRRVLYNNGEIPGDVNDFFMGPDSAARLYVSTNTTVVLNYSRWYRKVQGLADKPDRVVAGDTTSPHFAGGSVSVAGRFPAFVEPYETPRADLAAVWGRNTKGTGQWDLVKVDTPVAGRDLPAAQFPLVLTTIRCVEHFQGGPITRNNWWNVELEPEPWIEINLTDARKYGISNGDMVKVVSARTEGLVGDMLPAYGQGFRARVGSGLSHTQKVGPGVVAIPWHWGDKGLSTGSRANDVTIDAMDANTTIPEYKACLCRIEKM